VSSHVLLKVTQLSESSFTSLSTTITAVLLLRLLMIRKTSTFNSKKNQPLVGYKFRIKNKQEIEQKDGFLSMS